MDYSKTALAYIRQMEGVVSEMRGVSYNRESDYNMVSMPIMQIKGQAGMFGNELATVISHHILIFLEKFQRLDDAVLDIIDAYGKAIKLSYDLKLYNPNTQGGKNLIRELDEAMNRYRKKFAEKVEK